MFVEMKKQRLEFRFGEVTMWLRYDIQAFYNIEDSGFSPFDILSQSRDPAAVRCFLKNGLADWFGTFDGLFDNEFCVNRLMSAEGFQTELIAYIQAAIMLALPKTAIGNRRKNDTGDSNILGLMSMFVDVMGASREEFMSSTLREATERWERYATAMGYMKPAEKFSRFDDE